MIVVSHDAQGERLAERDAPELSFAERVPVVVCDAHPGRFIATIRCALAQDAVPLLLPHGTPRARALDVAHRVGASALVFSEDVDAVEVVPCSGTPLAVAEPGYLACTSGTTTSEPSTFFFSLGRARENARAHLASFGLASAAGLRMLMPLPTAHSFGFVAGVLAAEVLSATLHVTTQLPSPSALFALLARERIELFHTTPTGVRAFARMRVSAGGQDVSALRAVGVGSSSVLAQDARELARHFPHAARYATYGLTECGPRVATLDLVASGDLVASLPENVAVPLGEPLEGVTLAVADPDAHGIGELVVTTPYLARGRVKLGAVDFLDSGRPFRTADTARRDEHTITVLGRADGVVVRGGTNVYPATVEAVVERVPGVRRACLVARPSAAYGEVPVIVVEGDERTEAAIAEACARDLTLAERPVAIVFVDELPRTSLGKVQRSVVARVHGGAHV